ncbi:MAG: precorrin-6y C5,15-methyltransferase (decarboxylating) subunit CbiE [Nitrospirae bacterium]|nr:precorrin-6y C5,15-methyltransferase (decarboxylating) subunit CbiE [Nitrospirota bacterium]
MNKIYVIGIGYRPLDKGARKVILNSSVILASKRLFEVFKSYKEYEKVKDKIKVINNVDETINFIKSLIASRITHHASRAIVLLASGDPMFFGIGRRIVNEFANDIIEILPDLSSVQVAFSKIKETWSDAFFISLHGGPDPKKRRKLEYKIKDIPFLLTKYSKLAILTDKENNPSVIAKILNSKSLTLNSELKMFVCEKLGYLDERIIKGTPHEIAGMLFTDPNVVIIKKSEDEKMRRCEDVKISTSQLPNFSTSGFCFGIREDEIQHSRGLITKDEVRAVTIHKLRLPPKGVFWDIGAGSGSVSIEVARLYPELKVFAIERDEEQVNHIKENMIRHNTSNIEIIKGNAPEILSNLPEPDRVFIGGSSGRIKEIIEFVSNKISSGVIVINATTIETLNGAIQHLENNEFNVGVSEISVSRVKTMGGKRHMNALNTIFVITGER